MADNLAGFIVDELSCLWNYLDIRRCLCSNLSTNSVQELRKYNCLYTTYVKIYSNLAELFAVGIEVAGAVFSVVREVGAVSLPRPTHLLQARAAKNGENKNRLCSKTCGVDIDIEDKKDQAKIEGLFS